ncbi:four-carbon acid sugar kinase family protein [Neotabrizicola sp. sgz301269]|uniref:four-carbon acid sugar kinase family protein n=1 Tax=Neotabrizicola sp. sgz301269 TaxID=3276282 RepID=UPI0037703DE7
MLCIIADDLTGAFDAAAPFAGRGVAVAVALEPAALADALVEARSGGVEVLAVSTRSREIAADEASARVAAVAAQLPARTRLFKKVDSRLKGHVAAELAALAAGKVPLLVAPAIPDFGRIVRGGAVTGFGVDAPIPVAAVLGALAAQAEIPDTSSADDLRAALARAPDEALLVGARGLAEALAIAMTGQEMATARQPQAGRALMVVGSRDPITLAQVATLKARGADWRGAPNGRLEDRRPLGALTLVQALPGVTERSGAEVALALAASVHPALTAEAEAIFLTGGATAEAVMQAMGLRVLRLEGEVLPGVPLARAGGRAVIVKSGGFGGDDTLTRLADLFGGARDGTG